MTLYEVRKELAKNKQILEKNKPGPLSASDRQSKDDKIKNKKGAMDKSQFKLYVKSIWRPTPDKIPQQVNGLLCKYFESFGYGIQNKVSRTQSNVLSKESSYVVETTQELDNCQHRQESGMV